MQIKKYSFLLEKNTLEYLLRKYLSRLPEGNTDYIYSCGDFRTSAEAKLLTEINSKHCEKQFGREPFTTINEWRGAFSLKIFYPIYFIKLAWFNILHILSDTIATAIAYVHDKKEVETNVLIFDLGGGTLDVSILTINDGGYW